LGFEQAKWFAIVLNFAINLVQISLLSTKALCLGLDLLLPLTMIGIVMDIPTDPKKLFMGLYARVDSLTFRAVDVDDDDSSTSSDQSTNLLVAHKLLVYN
jgi:hypothetical protein